MGVLVLFPSGDECNVMSYEFTTKKHLRAFAIWITIKKSYVIVDSFQKVVDTLNVSTDTIKSIIQN